MNMGENKCTFKFLFIRKIEFLQINPVDATDLIFVFQLDGG